MRIFGRSRVTQTSAFRRTNAAASADTRAVNEEIVVTDLAATDEMPIVRETLPQIAAYPALTSVVASVVTSAQDEVESTIGVSSDEHGDSDVFVCRRSSSELGAEAAAAADIADAVTLFVYGWDNVEPGPLSWAFPSLRAALDAVRTMRNAIEWCIVAGAEWTSIDAARAKGAVLVEQNV
jgi:hypothetical protein